VTNWYVHRDNGNIVFAAQYPQTGYATEQVDDATSDALKAFLNPQSSQLQRVDAFRDARLAAGFADSGDGMTGKTFQCDAVSRGNWTGLAAAAQFALIGHANGGPAAPDITIICADNSQITLSSADCFALFATRVAPWVQSTIFYARTMKNAILADSPPDDYTAGWP